MSILACLLTWASFLVPLWQSGYLESAAETGGTPFDYVLALLFYVATYSVMFFFNAAVVECAIIRFRGDNPTVMDGLKGAFSRFPQILGWAVVAATVGMLIRMLQERLGFIGRLVVGLIGLAWTAATFFVVPVIVMERLGPVEAVKRSTEIVKKNWAEAVGANTGVNLIAFAGCMLMFFVMFLGGIMIGNGMGPIGLCVMGVGLLGLIAVMLCTSVVQAIVVAALYLYAGQGQVPDQFQRETLDHVFAKTK
jgi:hypothetical protein